MIQDKQKWHYLGVTTLSALLRRIRPTNNGEIYCLDCLQLVRTKKKKEFCCAFKKTENIPFGFPVSTILSFKSIKSMIYTGDQDCMEKYCKCLKEHGVEIINVENKEMVTLSKNSRNHMNPKACYIKEKI